MVLAQPEDYAIGTQYARKAT